MKRLTILFILAPLAAHEEPKKLKRLELVVWNPVEHVLYWDVSEGHNDEHGQYEPERLLKRYSVDPINGTMKFDGDTRVFMRQEADGVHQVLDAISHYAMSSTLWWEDGKSQPLHEKNHLGSPNQDQK